MEFKIQLMSFRNSIRPRLAKVLMALGVSLFANLPAANAEWGLPKAANTQQSAALLDTLAALPSLQPPETASMFGRLGFVPNMSSADWNALSYREQVEIAYRAAEAGNPPSGKRLLLGMARIIEERYESLAFDPAFRASFQDLRRSEPLGAITFGVPTKAQLSSPLPAEVARQLDALSVYVQGNGELGRVNVLRKHFGLRSPKLEEALAKRDPKEFLRRAALLAVPPPTVAERANALALDAFRNYDSALNDPGLRAVHDNLLKRYGEPPISLTDVTPAHAVNEAGNIVPGTNGGGGGGGGGSPERMARAAEAHAKFDDQHYRAPESRTFAKVRARAGGRGGVIAGSPIRTDASVPAKPVRISIQVSGNSCAHPQPESITGDLLVETADGQVFSYRNIPCDILVVSKRIVFDRAGGLARWVPGEAIGLVTIDLDKSNPIWPYFLPANLDISRLGTRKRMILHPALVDWDIGRAVALVDLWPSASVAIARLTSNAPVAIAWLSEIRDRQVTTWKWSDADVTIAANNRLLVVKPQARNSILMFREFDRADSIRESERFSERVESCRTLGQIDPAEFLKVFELCALVRTASARKESGRDSQTLDAAAPLLIQRIRDFARVETLLRTLAIFRWARAESAQFSGGEPALPEPGRRAVTPDTVIVGEDRSWIAGGPAPTSFEQDCNTFVKRLDELIAASTKPETAISYRPLDAQTLARFRKERASGVLSAEVCKQPRPGK